VHRPTALLCLAALSASGLALAAPAVAVPAQDTAAAAVPGELVVGYVRGATPAAQDRARGRAQAVRAERVVQARADRAEVEVVKLPPGKARAAAVRELQDDPAVAYAEPNWTYTHQAIATDPGVTDGRLWGVYGDASSPANQFGSQAAEAWGRGSTGSKQVYVGVIDEGIQVTHPDLDANVWTNPFDAVNGRDDDLNGYVDDTNGYDFANRDASVYDGGRRGSSDDHGTHVAGTIAAEANNGAGVAGVTWSTTLISGKFLGSRGGSLADAVKAVDYFTDLKERHGLNIVATNNSWGGGGYSQTLFDAIARANAANILFVAAAGNSGTNNDVTASYPAGYDLPNVISVAAIDKTGGLASFSQYGGTTVDLGAPGVDVWSATAFNGYSTYNGTSMATPHVTGAAALYAASHPGASAAAIRDAILTSVVPTGSLGGKTVTGGRLDASGF
jgi:subtilisin family serine protease